MALTYTVLPEDEEKLLSSVSDDGSLPTTICHTPREISDRRPTTWTRFIHWTAHALSLLVLSLLLVRELRTGSTASGRNQLYSPAYPEKNQPLHYESAASIYLSKPNLHIQGLQIRILARYDL